MSEDLHPPAENRMMSRGFLVLGFILIMALCSDAQREFIVHFFMKLVNIIVYVM